MSKEKPRVLIEDWLPVAAIGAESQRERGASSAFLPALAADTVPCSYLRQTFGRNWPF